MLPILELYGSEAQSKNRHVKVLILVPTRELAIQVNEVVENLSIYLPYKIKSLAVFGGVSINPQMIDLQGTEILVATPGRLLELVSNNAVSLSAVKTLVLDEADKMLNLGFEEEMSRIIGLLPKRRQNLLFSATLSDDINNINKILLKNPVVIKVEEENKNIDLIKQFAYMISEEKKGPMLRYIIKHNKIKQVLVFTSSVHRADAVAVKLNVNGINASAIHSKKVKRQERRR